MRAEIERFADLIRMSDVPLGYDRDAEPGDEGFDEKPGGRADAGGIGGVAAECCSYGVGTGCLCGESILYRSDVGAGRATEFGVNAADDAGPGLWFGETAAGAVESDDVGARFADGAGSLEVRSDVDVAAGVEGLGKTDDRKIGLGAKGGNARNAFGAESTCSSTKSGDSHAGEGVEVVERVALGCLAGDDESATDGFENRTGSGGLVYRHRVFLQNAGCCLSIGGEDTIVSIEVGALCWQSGVLCRTQMVPGV